MMENCAIDIIVIAATNEIIVERCYAGLYSRKYLLDAIWSKQSPVLIIHTIRNPIRNLVKVSFTAHAFRRRFEENVAFASIYMQQSFGIRELLEIKPWYPMLISRFALCQFKSPNLAIKAFVCNCS